MRTIISSNELFTLFAVETFDITNDKVDIYYELFESPCAPIEIFKSLSKAQHAMRQKTEFWKQFIRKTLYVEAYFIA